MYYPEGFVTTNKHLHTVIPALLFRTNYKYVNREKITLSDGDFVHLDWGQKRSKKLVLLLHGLESSADQFYMRHTAQYLETKGFSLVSLNYRGCSGIPNTLFKGYHSGCSNDLREVVQFLEYNYNFEELYLLGFSLGGNIVLKYLAENTHQPFIKKGLAFSAPIDLKTSSIQIGEVFWGIYEKRFMEKLKKGLALKALLHPKESVDLDTLRRMKKFVEFDDYYTAPANGFLNAEDYYKQASSLYQLDQIETNSLLISAYDDPFLSPKCYPQHISSKAFNTEYHNKGGHLGFIKNLKKQQCWYPERAASFFMQ